MTLDLSCSLSLAFACAMARVDALSPFTIIRGDGHDDENTGLAFSPDNMFLYTAWQAESAVYAFWRLDGLPFSGHVAYTKYHTSSTPWRH